MLAKQAPFLLLLAVIAFYFYGLGHLPLVGPDEPRYAQVAREMLMRGDLITPTLGGYTWFEKPVLLYWFMILSYKLLGVTELAARLGPATAGVLTVLAVYWLARTVEAASSDADLQGLGLWSALVAATTLGIIVFSRAASFDILVTMTITWALAFFFAHEVHQSGRKRGIFLAAFYVFVGLSLLAKGLVGFLPLGVVGTYLLLRREIPERRLLISLIWGIPLALAVAAIWYGPVIARHGSLFVNQFVIQHHFARYLSNRYSHPQPFFFYLVILVPLTLPWTPFFINGVASLRCWQWRGDDSLNRMRVLSLAGLLLPTLFFSFSGSKLPGYIVPVLPAAALLAGERVTRFISTGQIGKGAMRLIGVLCLLFAAGSLFYASRFGMVSIRCALAIVLPIIVAGFFILVRRQWRTACAIVTAGATIASLIILLNCGVDNLAQRESVKHLIEAADGRGYSRVPICGLHVVERSVEFYASGRLVYGPDGEPAKFEGAVQVLERARNAGGLVLVLVPIEHAGQLTNLSSAKTEVIADNAVLAIVALHRQ
ncbi:MAG TPA: glycosyltransferase family 39 protein [Pyrinomonadaceae bacterium]|nr:glycosyltransferase family 39 protein [Pyrinomonadaceae bacterium]